MAQSMITRSVSFSEDHTAYMSILTLNDSIDRF